MPASILKSKKCKKLKNFVEIASINTTTHLVVFQLYASKISKKPLKMPKFNTRCITLDKWRIHILWTFANIETALGPLIGGSFFSLCNTEMREIRNSHTDPITDTLVKASGKPFGGFDRKECIDYAETTLLAFKTDTAQRVSRWLSQNDANLVSPRMLPSPFFTKTSRKEG